MQLPEQQPIVELTYISQEQIPGLEHRKSGLVDIKCTDKAGNIFIVEMQNGYAKHLLKRLQFYSSSAYVAQLKQGRGYGELAPVFVIVLLGNQVLSPNLPLISYHKMIETDSGEHLFQDISYIVVELKKFTKREDELESYLDYWLYFLFRWDTHPPKKNTQRRDNFRGLWAIRALSLVWMGIPTVLKCQGTSRTRSWKFRNEIH